MPSKPNERQLEESMEPRPGFLGGVPLNPGPPAYEVRRGRRRWRDVHPYAGLSPWALRPG